MLSSFFNKSKPINYIAIAIYMATLFAIVNYKHGFELTRSNALLVFTNVFLYILPILALNLVAHNNKFAHKNTFTILLYAFFTAMLPSTLMNFSVLFSNIFVILAFHYILHLRNQAKIKENILNASICIGLASLTNFWSIGFIILVFLGVYFFGRNYYRNWLIPFVGVGLVYFFANCINLFLYDSFFSIQAHITPISLSFSDYFISDYVYSVGILSFFLFIFAVFYLIKFGHRITMIKPRTKVLLSYLLLGMVFIFIAPDKNTSEIYFITAPLAIIGTIFLEMKYKKNLKEVYIWLCLLAPFTILFL